MESKIEKLKGKYYIYPKNSKDEVVEYLNALCEKQNEIIDHLNSQAQPEENEVNEMYDFNERKITTYIVDEDKVITILRQEEMPEWLKKGDVRVLKDTPEEKEELTKEEWFMLKLAVNEIHNKGNGAYDEISRKIDRLSKLKDNK
ncbi:hypothetical protein GX830_00300 [Candidatus Dojkabacteria bacterium]|nr:hypothetical protein [Candidatus Dojkabacteria bacterium]